LVAGIVLISIGYFVEPAAAALSAANIHGFHFISIVFALLVVFLLFMGTVAPSATAWKIKTDNEIDLTPWKGAKWVGAALVLLVIGIYAAFAG
jgi:SSS family solute:Na+ symporter